MTLSDDDDMMAAEYALGTLDRGERAAAAMRRSGDAAFDRAVAAWEARLAPLDDAVRDAEPSPAVWDRILASLPSQAGASAIVRPLGHRADALERQVRRWRAVAAFTTAMAAVLALWIAAGAGSRTDADGTELVAFLQKSGDEPAYVMGVDFKDERLVVRPIAARAPEGKSYELWVIDPAIGPPRSLGTLDARVTSHHVPTAISRDVLSRATYAVTLEAAGGSPTGAPAGAPVFVGHLVAAPR